MKSHEGAGEHHWSWGELTNGDAIEKGTAAHPAVIENRPLQQRDDHKATPKNEQTRPQEDVEQFSEEVQLGLGRHEQFQPQPWSQG